MLCETVREQLHTLSDGERLENRSGQIAVLAHCVHCSQCRAFRRQLKLLRQTALNLPNTRAISASLGHRIFAQLPFPSENPAAVHLTQPHSKQITIREKEMKKRIVFATAALVIPVVAGTLAAQSRRANLPLTREQLSADQKHVDEVNASLNDPKVNAAFLKRLKELRLKWQFWARDHHKELKAMLRETGSQRTAFDRVQKLLPQTLNHTAEAALTDADLDMPGLIFAYLPQAIHSLPLPPTNRQKEAHLAVRLAESNLTHHHDIEIITTMKPGNGYTLWASGRITQNGNVSPRKDEFRSGVSQEVTPPYPFLMQ